jgi:MYXO-CTERM domain-containing protein
LRLADIDGDRKADLCGRAATGFVCWLSTGTGFGGAIEGPDMADAGGWDAPQYFATFRVLDITGDGKADVCGRGASGIACWPFEGASFGAQITGPAWSDANGWGSAQYYGTIQAAGGQARDDGEDPVVGTGGSASGGSSSGNFGGQPNPATDVSGDAPAGCACRAAGPTHRASGLSLLALLALGLMRRVQNRSGVDRRGRQVPGWRVSAGDFDQEQEHRRH